MFPLPSMSKFVGDGGAEEKPRQTIQHVNDPEPTLAMIETQSALLGLLRVGILRAKSLQRWGINQPKLNPYVEGKTKLGPNSRCRFSKERLG